MVHCPSRDYLFSKSKMSDLRSSVAKLTHLIVAWSTTDLAELAQASVNRTQAYLANLANQGVVVQAPQAHHWLAGPRAREWRVKAAATGPSYGHRKEYKRQRSIMDRLKLLDWQARRGGKTEQSDAKVASQANLATLTYQEVSGRTLDAQEVTETDMATAFRLDEAAEALAVSPMTVRRLIQKGQLKAFLVGERGMRITTQEVEAFKKRNEVKIS